MSRSAVSRQPAEIRAYIEGLLVNTSMTYDEKVAELRERFPDEAEAGELPSRSAMQRYGQKLNRRLEAIRASTEAAKIIRAQAGDEMDARSEALTAMIQSELFESIIALQEAGDEEMDPAERVGLLATAAKNIATLTRSSVYLKKFQSEAEEQARTRLLQEQQSKLDNLGKTGALSPETLQRIRQEVYGL
ncbi:DUF3486 family protein [Pseudomonas sp. o96-267]|uniref:phage protein Gp27 family protein n=1 Tax=Pseudomonas sp. o96-267 TaxID=2479853 RepID=UPI000F7AB5DB|nr:phage protein Gp27 family protein [Pseudomonas sp. o96-267]RRV28611.1 DUF3486 family protein [Pseudomonas sp. o96-267]